MRQWLEKSKGHGGDTELINLLLGIQKIHLILLFLIISEKMRKIRGWITQTIVVNHHRDMMTLIRIL